MPNIYTAIIGGVDQLSDAPSLANHNFHCYTDSPLQAKNYAFFPQEVGPDKWLESRKFKILAHHYNQEPSLWIDGRVELSQKVLEFIDENLQHDFSVFRHPYSKSIEEEAERCLKMGILKNSQLMNQQLNKYREQGFQYPDLMAGGIILRRNTEQTKAINTLWWQELNEFPTRDEISLPYVLWKLGVKVNVIEMDIFDNPYFKFNARRMGDDFLSKLHPNRIY